MKYLPIAKLLQHRGLRPLLLAFHWQAELNSVSSVRKGSSMFRFVGSLARRKFNAKWQFLAACLACFPFCSTPLAEACPPAPVILSSPATGRSWTPQIQVKGNPIDHNGYISWGDNTTVKILPITKETVARSSGGYFIWSAPPHTYATPGPKAMDIWIYPKAKHGQPCKYTLIVNVQ